MRGAPFLGSMTTFEVIMGFPNFVVPSKPSMRMLYAPATSMKASASSMKRNSNRHSVSARDDGSSMLSHGATARRTQRTFGTTADCGVMLDIIAKAVVRQRKPNFLAPLPPPAPRASLSHTSMASTLPWDS